MWLATVKAGSPDSNTTTSTTVLPRQGLPSQGLSLTLADSLTAVERSLLAKPSQRPSQPNHPSLSPRLSRNRRTNVTGPTPVQLRRPVGRVSLVAPLPPTQPPNLSLDRIRTNTILQPQTVYVKSVDFLKTFHSILIYWSRSDLKHLQIL